MIEMNKEETEYWNDRKDEGIRFNSDSNIEYQPLSKEEQAEVDVEIERVMRLL